VSLGLRLQATLSSPCGQPDSLLDDTAAWIRREYPAMFPKTRRCDIDGAPALFCQLHPAAEDMALSLVDHSRLIATANTTTVGPGYHAAVTSLLHAWTSEFRASWENPGENSEEFGDETGFFFTGDQKLLVDGMTDWLQALAKTLFEEPLDRQRAVALCMPMDPQFEAEAPAITPLGPRTHEWLQRTADDGFSGKDFFAWWFPGFDANYYLGRALAAMWQQVRWRSPIDVEEESVLREVAESLRNAYRLDSSLPYPWPEWRQILDLLGERIDEVEFPHAILPPTIGYRRGHIRATLPGGWSLRIPGSLSRFSEEGDHDFCAVDPPREIWFTAYRSSAASPRDAFESAAKEIKESQPEFLIERPGFVARARIKRKSTDAGVEYFVLSSSNHVPGGRAVCTVVFQEPEQREWALATWRSLREPGEGRIR
jgi:hypothetical protein